MPAIHGKYDLFAGDRQQEGVVDLDSIVVFRLGSQKYGVPIGSVKEIIPCSDITPAPGTPPWFLGFMNVRGDLVPVVSLTRYIGMEYQTCNGMERILILMSERGTRRGFQADEVTSIEPFSPDDIQSVRDRGNGSGFPRELIKGVSDTGKELVVVLDVERLLAGEGVEDETA